MLTLVFLGGPLLLATLFLGFGLVSWRWGPAIAFLPACVAFFAFACFFIVPALVAPRRRFDWEEHYRLSRFAWENGLRYTTESAKPRYRGVMFANAPSIVYNHLVPMTGRFFNIGNVRYGQRGSADTAMSEAAHRGFVAVHIGGALPQIILDARANDGLMGGVGLHLTGQPTVTLEGDFSEHFTLYCPPGYERDALYVLTPDLMVDLLDETLPFDVELIGEWMFVYAMKPFDLTDPAVLARLFRIVQTVGRRAARRASRYRDDQYSSAQRGAAKPQGPRLNLRVPRALLALTIVFCASLSWIPIGLFLGFAIVPL